MPLGWPLCYSNPVAGDRLLTLHPEGKSGVNIAREKYEAMREAILAALGGGELTHTELVRAVEGRLQGRFEGSIPWYMESVKLDLLARGVIERVGKGSPQRLRLVK